jgi:hypothetical protein
MPRICISKIYSLVSVLLHRAKFTLARVVASRWGSGLIPVPRQGEKGQREDNKRRDLHFDAVVLLV